MRHVFGRGFNNFESPITMNAFHEENPMTKSRLLQIMRANRLRLNVFAAHSPSNPIGHEVYETVLLGNKIMAESVMAGMGAVFGSIYIMKSTTNLMMKKFAIRPISPVEFVVIVVEGVNHFKKSAIL